MRLPRRAIVKERAATAPMSPPLTIEVHCTAHTHTHTHMCMCMYTHVCALATQARTSSSSASRPSRCRRRSSLRVARGWSSSGGPGAWTPRCETALRHCRGGVAAQSFVFFNPLVVKFLRSCASDSAQPSAVYLGTDLGDEPHGGRHIRSLSRLGAHKEAADSTRSSPCFLCCGASRSAGLCFAAATRDSTWSCDWCSWRPSSPMNATKTARLGFRYSH